MDGSVGGAAVVAPNPAVWTSEAAKEGRIIVLYATTADDLPLVFINIYQVNTLNEDRIPVREESHAFLREAVLHWQSLGASIILLGDMNVMPNRGDCFDPQRYDAAASAGTRLMERDYFHKVLCGELGLVDVGRVGEATWFSPPPQPSKHRIDFCLVSPALQKHVVEVKTHSTLRTSDHVPVTVRLALVVRRWGNATLEASPAPGLDVTVRSTKAGSTRDIRSFFGTVKRKRT
jgi:exonuclease III